MAELDLIPDGQNWNKVDWSRAAALGGVGALRGRITDAGGDPVDAGFGVIDGSVTGFGGSIISNA